MRDTEFLRFVKNTNRKLDKFSDRFSGNEDVVEVITYARSYLLSAARSLVEAEANFNLKQYMEEEDGE